MLVAVCRGVAWLVEGPVGAAPQTSRLFCCPLWPPVLEPPVVDVVVPVEPLDVDAPTGLLAVGTVVGTLVQALSKTMMLVPWLGTWDAGTLNSEHVGVEAPEARPKTKLWQAEFASHCCWQSSAVVTEGVAMA